MWLKPSCTTCRSAVAFLDARSVEFIRHDLAKERPPRELLARLVEQHGIEKVMNPRGRTFRERGIDPAALTKAAAVELMLEEPNLMRRPLLLAGGKAVFGFDREAYEALARR